MQNLHELYKIQDELKNRIGYKGPDKFEKMMLAMIVEFTEAANDWQGFKYWKKNNKPKETLLKEYVDGLHFVLETGLDLMEQDAIMMLPKHVSVWREPRNTIIKQFKRIIAGVLFLEEGLKRDSYLDLEYQDLFEDYLALGQMLGFNDEQIAAAYLKKVAVNHERQDNGY